MIGMGSREVGADGEFKRYEEEEAQYLRELLDVFETEGVDHVFVYTFARATT